MIRQHHLKRASALPVLLFLLPLLSFAEEKPTHAWMPAKHRALFDNYCLDCHDRDTQKGKLNLEDLPLQISRDIPTAEHWQNILDAINAGEMPPEKKTQIPAEEKAAFLSDLSVGMVKARNILSDSGGEITIRRLNRREYQNSLEALLGFRPDVSNLPDDDETGGFDTAGASLYFSSDQFEQYRATAKQALNFALPIRKRPQPKTVRFEGETATKAVREKADAKTIQTRQAKAYFAQQEKPASAFGFRDKQQAEKQLANAEHSQAAWAYYFSDRPESATGSVLPPGRHNGPWKNVPRFKLSCQYPGGRYKVRIRAASYPDVPEMERYVEFAFESGKERIANLDWVAKVTAPITEPEIIELEMDYPHGHAANIRLHQRNYEELYRFKVDMQWRAKNGAGRPPAIWVDYMEVEGPFFDDSLKRLPELLKPIEDLKDPQYAKELIDRFATVAFRGQTPEPAYATKLAQYYQKLRDEGLNRRLATIDCLSLILSSPSFLYLKEGGSDAEKSGPLSDRELAVRLAMFLWSAPPDEALLELAAAGQLNDPAMLRQQTDRLLRDPRAEYFLAGFGHQWLDMKRLDMFEFNSLIHPNFDETVRRSARQEVVQTLRHALNERLSLDTLLKADFVMVNDVLGEFYGLENVRGPAFRKVALASDSPRGGFLGMAAVHVMGSDGQRSSPVERGAWVLRHLLHDPPPPAPANVPMLEHEDAILPIRDLQKRHQEEPQCAQCHKKIDPIGYGLENFTAAGLWRETERVVLPQTGNPRRQGVPDFRTFPIDPSGQLPRAEGFKNYFGMRDEIATGYNESFARGFAEHLLAYGLGRPFEISDYNLATDITSQARENGNDIAAFVHALVQSKAFQQK